MNTKDLSRNPIAIAFFVLLGIVVLSLLVKQILPQFSAQAPTVVYRINAGGPQIFAPVTWQTDSNTSQSQYVNTGLTWGSSQHIDLNHSSLPDGIPEALFHTERYDPAGGADMQWDFPVSPGAYEVRLYFAEIYHGTQSTGARVFDVSIEGATVLDNYDVFADVGGYTAVMKSFKVNADNNIDIDFAHITENPAIKAIEIVRYDQSQLSASTENLDFGAVAVGNSSTLAVQLTNIGGNGNADITVQSTQIAGTNANMFTTDFSGAITLAVNQSTTVKMTFAPTSAGGKSASIEFKDGSGNTLVSVNLNGSGGSSGGSGTSVYRVNAGGPLLPSSPKGWEADDQSNPSSYVNTGNVYANPVSIDLSHSSIPSGTPEALFQSERWDAASGAEMQWDFPVTPGSYEVRLYFAEIYSGAMSVSTRVFDVSIEGSVVLDNYDIFADVGGNKAVMKSFMVSSDGTLDIDFAHVAQNPAIKAIEILQSGPGQLGASPSSLNYGLVLVGNNSVQSFQISNMGGSGDPNIVVQSAAVTGAAAGEFSSNFVGPVTLTPGEAKTINITFAPTSEGSKSANLDITHSGTNSPVKVVLTGAASSNTNISFGKSTLQGGGIVHPTSLQFGPDGRLYVAQQDGLIKIYTVDRNGANDYKVTATETLSQINSMPNRNDDGTLNPSVSGRLVTGILVAGTANQPVIYVNSSDPRIGAGPHAGDLNLDTNSGILSRLTKNGSGWTKLDLVRGLPRSEENHLPNGLALNTSNNMLYFGTGGNTNGGGVSTNFAMLPEYALSTAILSVDLNTIGNSTYDLPTLDDEDRPGANDANDPFGGNNGKNQAKLVPGGPVQLYATGLRNPYDVVITQSGRMYTFDNGSNAGWGGAPVNEGPAGNCTNGQSEPGVTQFDSLHRVTPGYYGGHPNPTRGNMANTFNASNPQSPVTIANPAECDYLADGQDIFPITTIPASTNGIAEYTASNFGGAMTGSILAASWQNKIHRIVVDATGAHLVSEDALFSNVGVLPLDVTAQGANDAFPGSIWVADYQAGSIIAFEPADYDGGGSVCDGAYDAGLDEDNDNFDNADELDNGTDPCSGADIPPDWDGDQTSDLNDLDDDNDGLSDSTDPFAIDANNGSATNLPIEYGWENEGTPLGGLLNLGFTGLMCNGSSDYSDVYNSDNMTAGGAAGVMTIDEIPSGDAGHASGNPDTQEYGFQFGINVDNQSPTFTVHTRVLAPFAGIVPDDSQSLGLFIGTGDQSNYLKIILGASGMELSKEVNGSFSELAGHMLTLPGPDYVDFYLEVQPDGSTVQASYVVTTGGVSGSRTELGGPETIPTSWLTGTTKMAVGVVSTSRDANTFSGTWDFIEVQPTTGDSSAKAKITIAPPPFINSSTYVSGTFQITNTSQDQQKILAVTFDLSSALLPDSVFDPTGGAGDVVPKAFTADSGATEAGFIGHSYSGAHDDGFDVVEATFDDFEPGETFTFSADTDPTSVRGSASPGPNHSASISGLELSGSTVTVHFDDGSQHSAELFVKPGTIHASENTVRADLPVQPSVQVLGIGSLPATVANASQTVRVSGPDGSTVALVIMESGLYTSGVPGGGFDLDPFEANTALKITEHSGTIGAQGYVDIPVTLTRTFQDGEYGGLNYITVAIKDNGDYGPSPTPVILEYQP